VSRARLALALTVAALAACARSSGEVEGYELNDAGAQAVVALSACGLDIPDFGTGTTWTDLYRDIFGPTGKPGSCSLESNCHGANAAKDPKAGANDPAGIKCFDQKSCRQSFFTAGLLNSSSAKNPDNAPLFGVLRLCQPNGSAVGIMPKDPVASFKADGSNVQRIKAWIRAGAPDN
jgi:hypothetical protein